MCRRRLNESPLVGALCPLVTFVVLSRCLTWLGAKKRASLPPSVRPLVMASLLNRCRLRKSTSSDWWCSLFYRVMESAW